MFVIYQVSVTSCGIADENLFHSCKYKSDMKDLKCTVFSIATVWPLASKYLCELMFQPLSARSSRPLRSADRCDLLVPRSPTSLSQNQAFTVVGPALWNDTPPALWSVMLQRISPVSLRSLRLLFSPACHAVGHGGALSLVYPFRPKGHGFDSRSSHHVGTLGKSFTHSCLWRFGVKFCHSIHAVSGANLSGRGLEEVL